MRKQEYEVAFRKMRETLRKDRHYANYTLTVFLLLELYFIIPMGVMVLFIWNCCIAEISNLKQISFAAALFVPLAFEVISNKLIVERLLQRKKDEVFEKDIVEEYLVLIVKIVLAVVFIFTSSNLWNNTITYVIDRDIPKITFLYTIVFYICIRTIRYVIKNIRERKTQKTNE